MEDFEDVMPRSDIISTANSNLVVGLSSTAWFEFLLDESLLDKHLNKLDTDLTDSDLISLFLYQSEIALATVREIESKETNINGNGTIQIEGIPDEKSCSMENRKVQMLRLLAIKTACHLKWNLDYLESNLPLAILRSLLLELLRIVTKSDDITSRILTTDDLCSMKPDALFATVLYHRWCLTSLIRESFPTRPSKIPNVQVPGLLDPSISSASLKDAILKSVRENMDTSISLLENFLVLDKPTQMPTMTCFGSLKGDLSAEKVYDSSNGIMIDKMEMACQISYDLGCVLFLLRNYEKANISFRKCKEYIDKVQNPVFCDVDIRRLEGYCVACSGVLCIPNFHPVMSLYERVQNSIRTNFQGLTGLLIQDLTKQELSLTYRASLEESALAAHRQDSLYEEVLVCNTIRRALEGRVAIFDLVTTLNRTLGLVDFFIKVCIDIHKVLPNVQKENLKCFLRYLCQMISCETHFIELLMMCELQTLFTSQEQSLMTLIKENSPSLTLSTSFMIPEPVEENVKVGELERELLVSYDPNVIRELIQKLINRIGKYQTAFLSDKWKVSRELHQTIENLPIPQPVIPIFIHILIAKSRICVQLQHFNKAREMLNLADSTANDISMKLSKLLRWEILRVDLLQLFSEQGMMSITNGNFQDLARRVKTCISTFQSLDNDSLPYPELMSCCVSFFLNSQDWDYLCSSSSTNANGFFQYGRMLAVLCKEIPLLKTARTPAREFIDAVRLTFTTTVQMKRNNAGALMVQENNMALLPPDGLLMLISMIKEPTVLSLFVSCLTKLFNLVKDDIAEEIYSDYTTLWPTALSGMNLPMNEVSVSEGVTTLMKHVLSVNPCQPSWLRTQADLCYAKGEYNLSLKYYIHLGVISTDFFAEPITKNVYDDQVYKRMIRCCSNLNCHTQVAVLCQFLDETDYTLAFKALQERTCVDAMDAYYEYIWDSTILEFLINLHNRRGEVEKRQFVMKLIGQMELNSNNRTDILNEAAKVRKGRFLRAMTKQYLATNS